MVIARSHVQVMICRYRGHQYRYSGHCVSFMQDTVKTVDTLPDLPSELDIVDLRPSDRAAHDDPRYQRQFRTEFRIRRGRVLHWLRFLKEHHPDYRYVSTSTARVAALPLDGDVSSTFPAADDVAGAEGHPLAPDEPVAAEFPPPTSHSVVQISTSPPRRRIKACARSAPELPCLTATPRHSFGRLLSTRPLAWTGSSPCRSTTTPGT